MRDRIYSSGEESCHKTWTDRWVKSPVSNQLSSTFLWQSVLAASQEWFAEGCNQRLNYTAFWRTIEFFILHCSDSFRNQNKNLEINAIEEPWTEILFIFVLWLSTVGKKKKNCIHTHTHSAGSNTWRVPVTQEAVISCNRGRATSFSASALNNKPRAPIIEATLE